ncbi:MAG: DUF4340 domain-containing protein [Cellvibrionaceae bacterium]
MDVIVDGISHSLVKDRSGEWIVEDKVHHREQHSHKNGHHHSHGDSGHHEKETDSNRDVSQAIDLLSRMKYDRIIAEGETIDMKAYGMASPSAILFAYTLYSRSPVFKIYIGDIAPDGIGRYVYVPDRKAVMIIPNFHAVNIIELIDFDKKYN